MSDAYYTVDSKVPIRYDHAVGEYGTRLTLRWEYMRWEATAEATAAGRSTEFRADMDWQLPERCVLDGRDQPPAEPLRPVRKVQTALSTQPALASDQPEAEEPAANEVSIPEAFTAELELVEGGRTERYSLAVAPDEHLVRLVDWRAGTAQIVNLQLDYSYEIRLADGRCDGRFGSSAKAELVRSRFGALSRLSAVDRRFTPVGRTRCRSTLCEVYTRYEQLDEQLTTLVLQLHLRRASAAEQSTCNCTHLPVAVHERKYLDDELQVGSLLYWRLIEMIIVNDS